MTIGCDEGDFRCGRDGAGRWCSKVMVGKVVVLVLVGKRCFEFLRYITN